jgi:pilus assembly protein Flp/PilA
MYQLAVAKGLLEEGWHAAPLAATAIEYRLIAAGIGLAIIPVITGIGTHLKTTFSTVSTALK